MLLTNIENEKIKAPQYMIYLNVLFFIMYLKIILRYCENNCQQRRCVESSLWYIWITLWSFCWAIVYLITILSIVTFISIISYYLLLLTWLVLQCTQLCCTLPLSLVKDSWRCQDVFSKRGWLKRIEYLFFVRRILSNILKRFVSSRKVKYILSL